MDLPQRYQGTKVRAVSLVLVTRNMSGLTVYCGPTIQGAMTSLPPDWEPEYYLPDINLVYFIFSFKLHLRASPNMLFSSVQHLMHLIELFYFLTCSEARELWHSDSINMALHQHARGSSPVCGPQKQRTQLPNLNFHRNINCISPL